MFNQVSGKKGEEIAVNYIKRQRYKIIERNFRTRNGEIDIIAIDESGKEKVLVCVEVKTRIGAKYGSALESITYWKKSALERTIIFYQSTRPHLPALLRIDLVAIQLTESEEIASIELVKNIVQW